MKVLKFEDLIAWQKAQDLAAEVYQNFESIKDFGFKDQITRAVVSISNNIAEVLIEIVLQISNAFCITHCHQPVKLDPCFIYQ